MLVVFGLIMFVALVVIHEWGHYIAARRNGIEVEEFGIGFPPKLKTLKRRHGTEFTLNWLPFGGFVKLKGEHDADTEKGSFGAASLMAKVKVMLAGVVMNLLVAFVLLTILALTGMPKLLDNQFVIASDNKVVHQQVFVGYIEKGSPAEQAGIQERDELKFIRTMPCGVDASPEGLVVADLSKYTDDSGCIRRIDQTKDLPEFTQKYADYAAPVIITIVRDGKAQDISANLRGKAEVEAARARGETKGYLGVGPSEYTVQRATWSAPVVAAGFMVQGTTETLKGIGSALGNLFTGNAAKAGEQVSGPVGIFTLLSRGSELGFGFVLMIIALISLTLAIMNALPIPAVDGGRLFVTLLFRILRKPLTPKIEEVIHGTGFFLLMVLFILITIADIKRL